MLRHRPPALAPSAGLEALPQTPLLAVYPLLLRLGLATAIGDFLRPAMELLEEYLLAFVRAFLLLAMSTGHTAGPRYVHAAYSQVAVVSYLAIP